MTGSAHPACTGAEALFAAALSVALTLVVGGAYLPTVWQGGLVNPDSYMRLARLHDMLAQGRMLHDVARDGSGLGTTLHWSHLLDALLLVLALPFRPFVPWPDALRWGGVLLGPLGMGALGASLVWAIAPLSGRAWRWTAALAAPLSIAVAGYGVPGVVHHHILLAAAAVLLGGLGWRAGLGDAAAPGRLGLLGGVAIWLSPEILPFLLMALGLPALAWARDPAAARDAIRRAGWALLATLLAALLLDPPGAGLAGLLRPAPDRLSSTFVVLAAGIAALGRLLRLSTPEGWSPNRRLAAVVAGAAIVLAGWAALFPQMTRGLQGLMDEETGAAFFTGIREMQPVASVPWALALLGPGLAGLLVLALPPRSRPGLRCYALACCVVIVVLGQRHVRFCTYSALIGALALPCLLDWLQARLHASVVGTSLRLAALGGYLLLPLAAAAADDAPDAAGCDLGPALALLRAQGGSVVLADVNLTPELLYRTGLRTVGSLYHRNPSGYLRLHRAWRERGLDMPPATLTATDARLLLICHSPLRSAMLAGLPPDTLMDRLRLGDPPAWLQAIGTAGNMELYAVR